MNPTSLFMTTVLSLSFVDDRAAVKSYSTLTDKYHIDVQDVAKDDFGEIHDLRWTTPTPEACQEYGRLLTKQINHYPVKLVEMAGLKKIVFCNNLTNKGKSISGCAFGGTMWVDIGRKGVTFKRMVIHHEFFHLLDIRCSKLGIISPEFLVEWESLSGSASYRGDGGGSQDDPITPASNDNNPGFVTWYAKKSVFEDRAEVFSHCILTPNRVARMAANDPVIKAKAEKMKQLIIKICPDIDDEFWVNHNALDNDYDR